MVFIIRILSNSSIIKSQWIMKKEVLCIADSKGQAKRMVYQKYGDAWIIDSIKEPDKKLYELVPY